MSRKGKLPISIPKGVEVKVSGQEVSIKGPKGTLSQTLEHGVSASVENQHLTVQLVESEEAVDQGSLHGLYRALLQNMVEGTTHGFKKQLEMIGVGYRAAVQGHLLDLQLGFSHPVRLPIPTGITISVEKGTLITIQGIDKQQVGQFAATIRAKRPPEPYQGKGIRYSGEYVRKKAGKSAAAKK